MKKLLFVSLALATALVISPAAKADSFVLTFSSGVTGSLDLGGPSIGGGNFDITSGSATVNGTSGSLLQLVAFDSGTVHYVVSGGIGTYYYYWPSHPDDYSTFDNILTYPGTPYMDGNGFAFGLNNETLFDIWYDDGSSGDAVGYYYNIFSGDVNSNDTLGWMFDPDTGAGGSMVTFAASQTPEPSSLLLLGTGLLLMAGFLFRKAKPGMIHTV